MRCFWLGVFLIAEVAAVGGGMGESRAEMLANVAAAKTTTGTAPWSTAYPLSYVVDEQLQSITGYVSGKNLTNAWWQVDLGAEFNFDVVKVYCRRLAGAGDHINGAYLCAYDDTHTQIVAEKLGGYYYTSGTDNKWVQSWTNGGNHWAGVRYVAIEDRDGTLNGGASGGCLWINEVAVPAVLPTYSAYLTGVTASGNMLYSNGAHADVQYELMVNGSGMTDQTGLPGQMLFGDPDARARQIHGGQWTSGTVGSTLPYLVYDLQQAYPLRRMLVWNRNAPSLQANGVKDVTISFSADGVSYTDLADTNGATQGTHTIAQSPGGNAAYQADIDMTGVTARYIKLSALSSWGGTANDWGIAEARFYVPEPSVLAMAAIGALVLLRRRRTK
jgi:hypothetical protein